MDRGARRGPAESTATALRRTQRAALRASALRPVSELPGRPQQVLRPLSRNAAALVKAPAGRADRPSKNLTLQQAQELLAEVVMLMAKWAADWQPPA